jgi:secreted trypsin-like serine protease
LAHISEFPHQVSFRIFKTNIHGCGGTIISHWHILTVAHCFNELSDLRNDVIVYAGITSLLATYKKYYSITRVHIHPDYTGSTSENGSYLHDIAVVTVGL